MKITIEIGGATAEQTVASAGADTSTPPPDVLARARAIGAMDGGAAPAELPHLGAPPVPAVIPGSAAPAPASESAVSAGPAPGGPPPPSAVVEQDPDAPTG